MVVDDHPDGDRDRDDAPGLAHLQVGGIQPQARLVAFERTVQESVDLLIDLAAQPRDLVPGNARRPYGLHQVISRTGRHTLDVGLLDHPSQRRLCHPARLQEAREDYMSSF